MYRVGGLAVAAIALAIPASAGAATYCVHTGPDTCPAGTIVTTDLQATLTTAEGTPERDTVMVRPGTYDAAATTAARTCAATAAAPRDVMMLAPWSTSGTRSAFTSDGSPARYRSSSASG